MDSCGACSLSRYSITLSEAPMLSMIPPAQQIKSLRVCNFLMDPNALGDGPCDLPSSQRPFAKHRAVHTAACNLLSSVQLCSAGCMSVHQHGRCCSTQGLRQLVMARLQHFCALTQVLLATGTKGSPHWSHTLRLAAVTNSTYSTNVVSCSGVIVPDRAMPPPTKRDNTCKRRMSL